MARTELWSRESQRGIPLWLPLVAVVLIAARIISVFMQPEHKAAASAAPSMVRWVEAPQAEQRAHATGKPIMYDFSAEWCGPCRQMDQAVFNNPRLAASINSAVIPVHVVDRQQEEGRNPPVVQRLQDRYSVNAFPTVVFAAADGKQLSRMEGFAGAGRFELIMAQATAR